jgi:hypothetical protein
MQDFDFKIYHVDRFDHALSESEADKVSFLSYTETIKNGVDQKIRNEYKSEEKRLVDFLTDLMTCDCSINKLKLKARKDQAISKRELNKLTEWEKHFLQNLNDHFQYKDFNVESFEQLESVIRLALKEKIRLVINFNNSLFSSGFDLCLFFQNIMKPELTKFTNKHGLHILGEWFDTLWTTEN